MLRAVCSAWRGGAACSSAVGGPACTAITRRSQTTQSTTTPTTQGLPKVLVIAGPTGVGKSAVAEAIAAGGGLDNGVGEIISADSAQVCEPCASHSLLCVAHSPTHTHGHCSQPPTPTHHSHLFCLPAPH
jgi:hypothetical protein